MENNEITKEQYHDIMQHNRFTDDNGFIEMIQKSMMKSFENFMSLEIKTIDNIDNDSGSRNSISNML